MEWADAAQRLAPQLIQYTREAPPPFDPPWIGNAPAEPGREGLMVAPGLLAAFCFGSGAGLAVVLLVAILKQFLFVGRPNELLIFSGRRHTLADGTAVGYRVVHGGF